MQRDRAVPSTPEPSESGNGDGRATSTRLHHRRSLDRTPLVRCALLPPPLILSGLQPTLDGERLRLYSGVPRSAGLPQ